MARILPRILKRCRFILLLLLLLIITGLVVLAFYQIPDHRDSNLVDPPDGDKDLQSQLSHQPLSSSHKLAVLVPFRDRFEELLDFVPHMTKFLKDQNVPHHIYVLNQMDNYRFNRASLINVGYLESKGECDYIAMHDVDLLPVNPALSYSFPPDGAFHIAAPELHPLYHYSKFVGGILLLKGDDFEKLNGLSNNYWGWGLEDDEFYVRMKKLGIKIRRPVGITTGNKTFRHIHDKRRRLRDKSRYFDQREKTRRLDKVTGVSTVKYTIDSKHKVTIGEGEATVINIKLNCDLNSTPWCLVKEDHEFLQQLRQQQGKQLSQDVSDAKNRKRRRR